MTLARVPCYLAAVWRNEAFEKNRDQIWTTDDGRCNTWPIPCLILPVGSNKKIELLNQEAFEVRSILEDEDILIELKFTDTITKPVRGPLYV